MGDYFLLTKRGHIEVIQIDFNSLSVKKYSATNILIIR